MSSPSSTEASALVKLASAKTFAGVIALVLLYFVLAQANADRDLVRGQLLQAREDTRQLAVAIDKLAGAEERRAVAEDAHARAADQLVQLASNRTTRGEQ